jgi:hypothetical protein
MFCVQKGSRFALTFEWLKNWIPSELLITPSRYDVSICPTLEKNGLTLRSARVGERAKGPCSGVWLARRWVYETLEHVVQALMPDRSHKVFDVYARKAIEGMEAERSIFGYAGPAELKEESEET